jgi:putative RNA 2'-phosphotransferase
MKVGQRRGRPVLLEIRSGAMHRNGIVFFVSDNGVWLTESVPPKYIEFPKDRK